MSQIDKKYKKLFARMAELSDSHEKIYSNFFGTSASKLERLEKYLDGVEDEDIKESRYVFRRGRVLTEAARDYWHGIRGARFVYHGDWGDPEIIYKGTSLDYYDVDEAAYDVYKDEHPRPADVSEDEYVGEYEKWLDTPEGKATLKGILFDLT